MCGYGGVGDVASVGVRSGDDLGSVYVLGEDCSVYGAADSACVGAA